MERKDAAEGCPQMQGIEECGRYEEVGAVKSNQLGVVLMVGRLLAEGKKEEGTAEAESPADAGKPESQPEEK